LSTPLHLAATYGFLEIAKLLILNGAEVDSRDLEQRTPMHMYCVFLRFDTVVWLTKMHFFSVRNWN